MTSQGGHEEPITVFFPGRISILTVLRFDQLVRHMTIHVRMGVFVSGPSGMHLVPRGGAIAQPNFSENLTPLMAETRRCMDYLADVNGRL